MTSGLSSEWIEALQWHLRLLERLYPPDRLRTLLREAGIELGAGGEIVTSAVSDLNQYLDVVGKCLGPIAMVNARIQLSPRLERSRSPTAPARVDTESPTE